MRILIFLLTLPLAFVLGAADDNLVLSRKALQLTPLIEDPFDTNIVRLTAEILKRSHYLRQELDDKVSSQFLDRYLDSLDNLHLYFLESDAKDFEKYRFELDDLTLRLGDSSPARVIFNRFRERLQQQYDYVTNLLQTEEFDFTGADRFLIDRKKLPRPRDLAEGKKLWRDRARYEYLQEKLNIGKPDLIAKIVAEKIELKKPDEIIPAIQDKLSKEKAEEISKLVTARLDRGEKPAEIAKAVVAKLEEDNAAEIVKIITRRYTRVLRSLNDYDNDDVLQIYLTALAHVYDPHSDYMGRSELENFSIGMKLSLFGIGALLRSEDGICKIQSLTANGPAERSGKLKPNDKIIAVAQSTNDFVDVVDMKLNKVVELIRGPKETEVRLRVIPGDAADPSMRKDVALVRDEIKLEDQEAKAKIIEMPLGEKKSVRLGVIDLPSFYSSFELEGRRSASEPKSTTTDVAKLIRKMVQEKVSGIVLDLRRNGGGSLEEAINLTGLFIKEGPVVQVKDSDGRVIVDNDPEPSVYYDGPLVVLTSRFSASASEILAGALQDYGRALVVGDSSTHGKGTVQSLIQLGPILRGGAGLQVTGNPGAVKITIRKFYRASGSSTQLKGVVPDIVLPSVNNHAEVGEAHLENALQHDTIKAASYDKLNRVEPYLSELRRRSDGRVVADQDYSFIREEIERYKKAIAEKSISLNEAERLKEKQEADERSKARRKELASRPEPSWKTYEITLKQVDLIGLPAPVTKTNKQVSVKSTNEVETAKANPSDSKGEIKAGSKVGANTGGLASHGAAIRKVAPQSDDEVADDQVPAVDITLEETKRILLDYISLLAPASERASTAALGGK